MFAQLFSLMINMSSAYGKWENRSAPASNLYTEYFPISVAFFINELKPFAAIRNKNGDNGSPCLNPRRTLNSFVGLPFTSTETDDEFRHTLIHLIHFSWKPIF